MTMGDRSVVGARRELIGRFLKYSYLVVALLLTTKIAFDGYSYYVARRSIDAELEPRKFSAWNI
jgi:hypothetical protein